ncbi:MAG: glycosyltransferase family 2 protein [Rhodospirillum sp.]|nr:glycosyltransferase family 2 protein [Rhodospirillum sp.]MCF8488101.1 glycosyltransferase family 2 protein [Rhodospirillum sp.]MCF8501573.1 glycosyltransferase family 2 protein [Rhodospirillum sp.]
MTPHIDGPKVVPPRAIPPTEIEVSILIPTYKRPDLLRRALRACAEQRDVDFTHVEILVVDNDPDASARPVLDAVKEGWTGPILHAFHEPRPGISHARNTAVAMARGRYLVFLDDDQCPIHGWLAALWKTARDSRAGAVFGPVTPNLHCAEDDPLRPLFMAYFSRVLGLETGEDITPLVASMGTQNSLFDRETAPLPSLPFDVDLGKVGGEDSVLLRRLVTQGARLAWAADALVSESVPADRCTLAYLRKRRFRDGQIRVLACTRLGRHNGGEVLKWMAVGAAQVAVHGLGWLLTLPLGGHRAAGHLANLHGGLGKLLWGRRFRFALYGG